MHVCCLCIIRVYLNSHMYIRLLISMELTLFRGVCYKQTIATCVSVTDNVNSLLQHFSRMQLQVVEVTWPNFHDQTFQRSVDPLIFSQSLATPNKAVEPAATLALVVCTHPCAILWPAELDDHVLILEKKWQCHTNWWPWKLISNNTVLCLWKPT